MTSTERQAALVQWLGDLPGGVAVACVDHDGVTFFNAGKFSAADSRPITADTEFEIGSVTKVFTALLLADAVDAGKIKLDDHAGAPFATSGITYAQLATHTSGLPRLPRDFAPSDAMNPYADQDLAALVKSFEVESCRVMPTAQSSYSNLGFAVLGQSVAGASGERYETLLRERILQPLGLHDTATSWCEADPKRLAPGHNEQTLAEHWDMGAYAPAGALVSTTRDLARFLQACLGFVETPLARTIAETLRSHAAGDTPSRRLGLAWILEQGPTGATTLIWHNGGTGGFRSVVAFDPVKKIGVVVLTNHTRGVEALGKALIEDKALAQPVRSVAPSPASTEYLGDYPLAPSFVMTITAAGDVLSVQATNQPRLTLRRTAVDEYAVEGLPASISFERDAAGKVVALVLHQNGANQRAPRVEPGATMPSGPKEIALKAEELEDYVGAYKLGPATFTVKRESDRLMVQLTGQPFLRVSASAKDEFFCKVVNAQLGFVRGTNGKIVALILHQHGRNQRAEKLFN
jgi:CubicO group peptidase (beta-lactamase class C family)